MRPSVLSGIALATLSFAQTETYRSGGGNNLIEFAATAITDPLEVKKLLGADLRADIVVVEIKVTPRGDEPLLVSPDDFTLLSHKDGQRSTPFSPAQLAGKGVLVVTTTARSQGGYGQNTGPIIGGIPGTRGMPRQLPGQGSMGGSATTSTTDVGVKSDEKAPEVPILKALKEKALTEKSTLDPVSGLLYFLIEGKVKPKDLTLIYKGAAGRVVAPFEKLRTK